MGQIRTGSFEADGNAYNLILGFVPNYIKVINTSAADTEVWSLEWFDLMGDAKEIWHYKLNNDGGDDVDTPVKKASAGYISTYDSNIIPNRVKVVFDYTGGASEDLLTFAGAEGCPFEDGERVGLQASGGLAAGLTEDTIYYVRDKTLTSCRLALTSGGAVVEFTSDGTPPNYIFSRDNLIPAVAGGKGVTVAAAFMDDGDAIYYEAIESDRNVDHGDIA